MEIRACGGCGEPVEDAEIHVGGQPWHTECFRRDRDQWENEGGRTE